MISFDFTPWVIAAMAVIALLSSFVQASLGLGFGIIFMALMPQLIGHGSAIAAMYIIVSIVIIWTIVASRKSVDMRCCWKKAWPCMIGNGVGIALGTVVLYLLEMTSPALLIKMTGGVLILMSLYFLIFAKGISINATPVKGFSLGGLSGILAGFLGIGGPPTSIYLLNATDTVDEYLSSIQTSYLMGNLVGVAMHIIKGSYTPTSFGAMVICLAPTVAGTVLGLKFAQRLNAPLLKKILYVFMIAMGIFLIVK